MARVFLVFQDLVGAVLNLFAKRCFMIRSCCVLTGFQVFDECSESFSPLDLAFLGVRIGHLLLLFSF